VLGAGTTIDRVQRLQRVPGMFITITLKIIILITIIMSIRGPGVIKKFSA